MTLQQEYFEEFENIVERDMPMNRGNKKWKIKGKVAKVKCKKWCVFKTRKIVLIWNGSSSTKASWRKDCLSWALSDT